jgi:hypothetical protein
MGYNAKLNEIQAVVDQGAPVHAYWLARQLRTQFNKVTMRRWFHKGNPHRRTYAVLVLALYYQEPEFYDLSV